MTPPGARRQPVDANLAGSGDVSTADVRGGGWWGRARDGLGSRLRWAALASGWSQAHLAFVGFALVALGVATALTFGAGEVYEDVVAEDGISLVDQPVLDTVVTWRTPAVDSVVTWFTHVGGPIGMPLLVGIVVLALAITARRWMPLLLTGLAAVGSLAMTIAGKDLAGRARPPHALAVPPFETSPSFPSGHTLNATVLITVVVYLVLLRATATWQRVVVVSMGVLFVLAMGLSRVFLGHHWLTDVMAGWSLGLAWALAVITAHRLYLAVSRGCAAAPQAR